jgi:hypothetical protein
MTVTLSRSAESAYWIGRYLERASSLIRSARSVESLGSEISGLDPDLPPRMWDDVGRIFALSSGAIEMEGTPEERIVRFLFLRADVMSAASSLPERDLAPDRVMVGAPSGRTGRTSLGDGGSGTQDLHDLRSHGTYRRTRRPLAFPPGGHHARTRLSNSTRSRGEVAETEFKQRGPGTAALRSNALDSSHACRT